MNDAVNLQDAVIAPLFPPSHMTSNHHFDASNRAEQDTIERQAALEASALRVPLNHN